jgi:hypothetical protein
VEGGALIETSGCPITPALNQCSSTPAGHSAIPVINRGQHICTTYGSSLVSFTLVLRRSPGDLRRNARSVVIFGFKSCPVDRGHPAPSNPLTPARPASSDSSASSAVLAMLYSRIRSVVSTISPRNDVTLRREASSRGMNRDFQSQVRS